jgi:hypothetical protein
MCVICLREWFCGIAKRKKGEPMKPRCTGKFMTQCDECLISIPIRHIRNLPPWRLFK